jgi:hypothetical protein
LDRILPSPPWIESRAPLPVIVSSPVSGIHVDAQTVGAAVHAVGLIRQDQMLDVGEGDRVGAVGDLRRFRRR